MCIRDRGKACVAVVFKPRPGAVRGNLQHLYLRAIRKRSQHIRAGGSALVHLHHFHAHIAGLVHILRAAFFRILLRGGKLRFAHVTNHAVVGNAAPIAVGGVHLDRFARGKRGITAGTGGRLLIDVRILRRVSGYGIARRGLGHPLDFGKALVGAILDFGPVAARFHYGHFPAKIDGRHLARRGGSGRRCV